MAAFCRCTSLYTLPHQMHPFGVNGLWLLCGHKQPSPLLLDRVQDGLHRNGSGGFYSRTVELHGKHQLCKQLTILQFQCHSSLLWQHPPHTLFKLSFLTYACMKASFPRLLVWIWSELCWWPSPPTHKVVIHLNHLWSMLFISVNKYSCRHEVSSYFLILINSTQEQMWNKS